MVELNLAEANVARVLKMQAHQSDAQSLAPGRFLVRDCEFQFQMKHYSNWAGTKSPNDKYPHFVSLFQAATASGEENGVYHIGTKQRARGEAQKKGRENSWGYLLQTGIIKGIFYECFSQGGLAEPGLGSASP